MDGVEDERATTIEEALRPEHGPLANGLLAAKCLGTRAANFMPGRKRQNGQAPLFFAAIDPRHRRDPQHQDQTSNFQRHQLNFSPIRPTLEPQEICLCSLAALQGPSTDCAVTAARLLRRAGPAGVWIRFAGDGFDEPASATPSLSTQNGGRCSIPMMEEGTPAAPPELQYGGYSRFELELEVGYCFQSARSNLVDSIVVCAVSGKPAVSELPGQPKDLRRYRVHRLSGLSAIFQRAKVCPISIVRYQTGLG